MTYRIIGTTTSPHMTSLCITFLNIEFDGIQCGDANMRFFRFFLTLISLNSWVCFDGFRQCKWLKMDHDKCFWCLNISIFYIFFGVDSCIVCDSESDAGFDSNCVQDPSLIMPRNCRTSNPVGCYTRIVGKLMLRIEHFFIIILAFYDFAMNLQLEIHYERWVNMTCVSKTSITLCCVLHISGSYSVIAMNWIGQIGYELWALMVLPENTHSVIEA